MMNIELAKNPFAAEVLLDIQDIYKSAGVAWMPKAVWVEEKDIYWRVSLSMGSYPFTCEVRIFPESFERHRLGDGYTESSLYSENVFLGLALFKKNEIATSRGLVSKSSEFLYERPPKSLSKESLIHLVKCILVRGVILRYASVGNRLVHTNIELDSTFVEKSRSQRGLKKLLLRSSFIPPIVVSSK